MKLSWSQKLFLKINKYQGKSKWRDIFFMYLAEWLIYLLGLIVLWWGILFLDSDKFRFFVELILIAGIFGLIDNWLIAFVWKHPRPIIQFPEIKTLFNPIEQWKAFPSDHTTSSFVLIFTVLFFNPPFWFGLFLVLFGLLIGFSRIYCGVHYPRDILGGIGFAFIYVTVSVWILQHISGPIYWPLLNLFK